MATAKWNRAVGGAIVAGLLAVSIAPAAAARDHADPWITMKSKVALLGDLGASALKINVDTIHGEVTLHGTVASESDRKKAEEAVIGVSGVRSVSNLLSVGAPPPAVEGKRPVARSDEEIRAAVEDALASEASLEGSDVKVGDVKNGVVTLRGKAESVSDHLRAVQVASRVPGVQRVRSSEVDSPKTLQGDEIDRDLDVDREPSKGGSAVGDGWITAKIKMKLLAEPDVPALSINVDTVDGHVTLFGVVSSETEKERVEAAVRGIDGVRGVSNELQIVAKSKQEAVAKDDKAITDAVKGVLGQRSDLKDGSCSVETSNGVVRLTGEVRSHEDRLAAGLAARAVDGVRAVRDELVVKPAG
jgi:hyperosmotically inducible protein